jgi:fumarate reductase subunit C
MHPARLYLWQRATAIAMVPLIGVHLALIYVASAQGLTAADILGRTRGSVVWGGFYALFVTAAAIHAAIGVRNVLREWGPRRIASAPMMLDRIMGGVGLVLFLTGLRAVYAVVAA